MPLAGWVNTVVLGRGDETIDNRAAAMEWLGWRLAIMILLGLIGLMLTQASGAYAAIGIGLIILLSSFICGAGIGFLFGVPRVLSRGPGETPPTTPDPPADARAVTNLRRRVLASNTNLERISDWLTTMLVGVGLSQFHNLNALLYDFRLYLSETARVYGTGEGANAGVLPAIGGPLLLFGAVCGFLAMYLYTRIALTEVFDRAERDLDELPVASEKAVRASAQRGADDSLAMRQISVMPKLSVDDAIQVMFNELYRPEGYKRVIEIAGDLAGTEATRRADFWFYVAAAQGQAYSAALANKDPKAADIRREILNSAQRAVAIDAGYKARLWAISNPNAGDNDLAGVRDDAAFHAIVGQPV